MTKVIIITGGTKGIGRKLVDVYLKNDDIVATFSSQKKNTQQLIDDYPTESNLFCKTLDIQNQGDCLNFTNEIILRFGHIDTYIFNSGICSDKSFNKMTYSQWQSVLSINMMSAFTMTQAVFQQMSKQSGEQQIFFMSSLSGITGAFGQANYAASKSALIGLSHTLSIEGDKKNIKVNTILPAAKTDMTLPVIKDIETNCQLKNIPFPTEWLIGTADELALSLYKLSNSLHLGTGQIYSINGNQIDAYAPPTKHSFQL